MVNTSFLPSHAQLVPFKLYILFPAPYLAPINPSTWPKKRVPPACSDGRSLSRAQRSIRGVGVTPSHPKNAGPEMGRGSFPHAAAAAAVVDGCLPYEAKHLREIFVAGHFTVTWQWAGT